MQSKTKRRLQWAVAIIGTAFFICAFTWGPWIVEGDRLYDKRANLVPSAGVIVTGFRTALVAAAAALAAGIGLRYTHQTLRHTRDKDRNEAESRREATRVDRYIQLVIEGRVQLNLKALDDPELIKVLDIYDGTISDTHLRQRIFADLAYRNVLAALLLESIPSDEFFAQVRLLCQNSQFRDYWEATREHRRSLTDDSMEAHAGSIIDTCIEQLADDSEEWWAVGQPPAE